MATIVIVGSREAALEAALQLGHRIVLVSDRRITKKRRQTLLAAIEADFSAANARAFAAHCIERMQEVNPNLPRQVSAVMGVTERAVLPAAWLRAQLELVGTSAASAYLCRNKLAMKRRLHACGIDCTDFVAITGRSTAARLVQRLGLPLVLKPVDSSGARGAIVARQQCDVAVALQPGMLAESFVHGIEMSVESFVLDGEVRFVNLTEYLVPLWSNIVPAHVTADMQSALLDLNRRVVKALGISRGMTHMEVFLTATAPIFSEIAVRPPGGYLMELLGHAYGFDAWHAFFRTELGESVKFPTRAEQCAGVVLLHPGEGCVRRVAGVARTKSLPGIVEANCRVSAGETLRHREGSGDSVAHIIATGKARADVVQTLTRARRAIVVELDNPKPRTRRDATASS